MVKERVKWGESDGKEKKDSKEREKTVGKSGVPRLDTIYIKFYSGPPKKLILLVKI